VSEEIGCLLAVDPGGTIGWVMLSPGGLVVGWGEERDHQAFLNEVWDWLNDDTVTEVVSERWVTMRGRAMTYEPGAQEQIGVIRWMTEYTGAHHTEQGAADAKAFGGPDLLKAYPAVGRGGGGHARMALRHALLYRAVHMGSSGAT
jgi:hypothetical protein